MDDAKDFVSFLLSKEYQKSLFGIPINKKSLANSIDKNNKKDGYGTLQNLNGEDTQVKVKKLDEDSVNKFLGDIQSLDNYCNEDKLILNQAEDEFIDYISGKNQNIDDVVDKISSKLQLYLQE